MTRAKRSPNDPQRRSKIISGALAVIAREGVHRTTHRRIAEEAGVPLGSLTYYFKDLTEIIEQAFTSLVEEMKAEYRDALSVAQNREQACEAFAELICAPNHMTRSRATAILEMYSYGNFNEVVGRLRADWMRASRESLLQHFSDEAASGLDALFEGWTLHGYFMPGVADKPTVLKAVKAVANLGE